MKIIILTGMTGTTVMIPVIRHTMAIEDQLQKILFHLISELSVKEEMMVRHFS